METIDLNIESGKADIRIMQSLNEEFEFEINKIKTECFSYLENIDILKDINNNLSKELNLRKDLLKNFQVNQLSTTYTKALKLKEISKNVNEFVTNNFPIISYTDNSSNPNASEFSHILFDHIQIRYVFLSNQKVKYNYDDKITVECEDSQNFKISTKSTFLELKVNACNYWSIDNFDDYFFTDIAEAMIYFESMSLNEYFLSYSAKDNNLKLISNRPIKERSQLIISQSEFMKQKNKFSKDKIKKNNENIDEEILDQKIKFCQINFIKEFPSLKPYMMTDEDQLNNKKIKNRYTSSNYYQAKNIETSFFMFIVLILSYIYNLFFIFETRDIGRHSIYIKFVNTLFDTKSIIDMDSFRNYMTNRIGLIYPSYKNENQSDTNLIENMKKYQSTIKFIFISPIKIVVSRVIYDKCENLNPISKVLISAYKDKCYSPFYNETTVYKDYKTKNQQLLDFLKVSQLYFKNISSDVNFDYKGLSGRYRGEGYIINVTSNYRYQDILNFVDMSIPSQSMEHNVTDDSSHSSTYLIDKTTRSWIMTFNINFPDTNSWMNVVIPIEFLATGIISAGIVQSKMFVPNIYEENSGIYVIDIFRILFTVILIFFIIIDLNFKMKTFSNPKEWISFKQIISIFILILNVTSFVIKLLYLNNNSKDYFLPNSNTYKDTSIISYYYNQIYFIESLLFEGLTIKLLDFLILNDSFKLFFNCIYLGLSSFFRYMSLVIFVLITFAVIAFILYGPFIDEYNNYQCSFIMMILLCVGYYDLNKMINYNRGWGIFFLISFFITLLLILFTVFISLFAESVKIIVVKNGYPDDYEDTQWQFKDYIVWLCHFVDKEEELEK